MKFGYRLFIGYFLLIVLAGWLFFREYSAELVPGMRQSLEEALVDSANLLAALVENDVKQGVVNQGAFAQGMERFHLRSLSAQIGSLKRTSPNMFVYITNEQGIIIYDSRGHETGADYSRWNDVYLTLQGKYGARTTRNDPNDPTSSVMYVAAPIHSNGKLIGVLTLAKPSMSVQPYIEQMRDKLIEKGLWLVLLSLLLAGALSFGLSRSIGRLTHFARSVQEGQRSEPPRLGEPELAQLADAMQAMRQELEGKDYVEQYLLTLTHELKSPLAAIQGASELLQEPMPETDRQRFLDNIHQETLRMQQVVERLLGLAAVEKRQGLQLVESIDTQVLLDEICESRLVRLQERQLELQRIPADNIRITGERFLLSQAIGNLLDNAMDFSPVGDTIQLQQQMTQQHWQLTITDQGPGIPEYAQHRIFERFYSLPRPDGNHKSTGLGLAFVREVAELHDGTIQLENGENGGAKAVLEIPANSTANTSRAV